MRKKVTYSFITTASTDKVNNEAGNVASKYCKARGYMFYSATVVETKDFFFNIFRKVTIEIRYK